MGKKRVNNTSKHIKTRHKKSLINRRVVTQKVDNPMKNINKIITDITNKQMQDKEKGSVENAPKIKAQQMNIHEFQQLLLNGEKKQKKQKLGKLSLDDSMYLQKLIKKHGTDFMKMSKDVRLNKMQWTANQIEKKHRTYLKMFPEEQMN